MGYQPTLRVGDDLRRHASGRHGPYDPNHSHGSNHSYDTNRPHGSNHPHGSYGPLDPGGHK